MHIHHRKPAVCCAALLLAVLSRPARAQIVTENAGVISPETPIVRESLSVLDAEHLREVRWEHQLIFAFDPARELKLTVPLVWRDVEFATPGGVEDADLAGLGDVSLRFKQSLWQEDAVMASTRWAALAEIGAPTGEDGETENGALIPRRLQLGTGDWSLGAGTAYTWIRDRQRFSAETLFRYRTRHEGLRLGETLDLNLAWWYRITPARFPPGDPPLEVRGVLELLSSYRWPSEGDGDLDDDGKLVWLAPGLQVYPSKTVLLEVALRAPIHQDLDDALGDRRWAGVLALKFLF
jgi:hypothetical protein